MTGGRAPYRGRGVSIAMNRKLGHADALWGYP